MGLFNFNSGVAILSVLRVSYGGNGTTSTTGVVGDSAYMITNNNKVVKISKNSILEKTVIPTATAGYVCFSGSGGRIIAASDTGIYTSDDQGVSWQQRQVLVGAVYNGGAFNGVTAIVCQSAGAFYSSGDNGTTWTLQAGGINGNSSFGGQSVKYIASLGLFVWAGIGGQLGYSGDGINWTATNVNAGATGSVQGMEEFNGNLYCVSQTGSLTYFSGGYLQANSSIVQNFWQGATNAPTGSPNNRGIVKFKGKLYVQCDYGIVYSIDGINFLPLGGGSWGASTCRYLFVYNNSLYCVDNANYIYQINA